MGTLLRDFTSAVRFAVPLEKRSHGGDAEAEVSQAEPLVGRMQPVARESEAHQEAIADLAAF